MTHRHHDDESVIYVERESGSIFPLFFLGAVVGAGLALLLSPGTGEENRRGLTRRMRSLRALAEEKVDELGESFGRRKRRADSNGSGPDDLDDDDEELAAPHSLSAREELERRLEEARARRRDAPDAATDEEDEDEEPLA